MEKIIIKQPVFGRYELTAAEGYILRHRPTGKTMDKAVVASLKNWEAIPAPVTKEKTKSNPKKKQTKK